MRKQDLFGVMAAIAGTFVIIGVSSDTSEPTLNVADLLEALVQPSFLIYFFVTLLTLIGLIVYADTEKGQSYIMVDLLIAGLLGVRTVNYRRIYRSFYQSPLIPPKT